MHHPHYVFVRQTRGDYVFASHIGQPHSSHIKTYAIKDQATFLFTEELHHIAAGVDEDENVPAVQASAHGVGYDTAQAIEALTHIDRLVIQPVPVCSIQVEHYPAQIIS